MMWCDAIQSFKCYEYWQCFIQVIQNPICYSNFIVYIKVSFAHYRGYTDTVCHFHANHSLVAIQLDAVTAKMFEMRRSEMGFNVI